MKFRDDTADQSLGTYSDYLEPIARFRDPHISLQKFRNLDDTVGQVQGLAMNFAQK
jgi:hypothetical protein